MKDLLNTKHFYIFENQKFKIFKTMFESLFFTNSNKNYKSFAFKYGGKNKLSVLKIKIFYINFLKLTKKMSDNALKDRVKKFLQVERISKTEFGEIADKSKKRDLETNVIKLATFDDYKQQLKTFQDFISKDVFLYKISTADLNAFLDDIYINKALTAVTRNHYLQTLRTFFNYAEKHGFIMSNPAKNLDNIKPGIKKRLPIPENIINQIFKFLQENNENYYLLACNLLYCCFIRPSEICGLKIKDLSFKNQTIFISQEISKNKKNQVVTMPQNVVEMLLDLKIYRYPSDYYIIGRNFTPSRDKCSDKIIRAKWLKIRQKLRLSDSYQFYSLKDSGITKMISLLDVAQVRDQARHSSISITDVYTDRTNKDGNEKIKRLDFKPTI